MGWRRLVAQGSFGIWLVACAGAVRSGPSETIRVFGAADTPITATGVTADEDGWRIERASAGPVPLFEVALPGLENATLTYRVRMKASDVTGDPWGSSKRPRPVSALTTTTRFEPSLTASSVPRGPIAANLGVGMRT